MTSPNPYLTELYQNGGMQAYSQEDLEKVAAVEALEKLAEENEIDLDDLSDEEVGELLAYVMDPEAGDAGAEDDDAIKEAQARFEEADFLGRVMAHANHQESEVLEFQKLAAAVEEELYFDADDIAEFAAANGVDPEEMDLEDFVEVDEIMQKEAGVKEKVLKHTIGRYRTGASQIGGAFRRARTSNAPTVGTKKEQIALLDRLSAAGRGAAKFAPEAGLGAGGVGAALALKGKKKHAEGLTLEDVAEFAAENYGFDPEEMSEEDFEAVADVMEKDAMLKEAMPAALTTAKANLGIAARKAGRGIAEYHRRGAGQFGAAFAKGSKESKKTRALRLLKGTARFSPHAAAAGGASYLATRKGKKKTASVLDEMVEAKAVELLAEAGYIE